MAHIDCEVNTRPMAQEIDSVSRHIDLTTTAVVGMKAAVISAEEEATTKVCNDVNRGFYALIHSQISQKIAKLQSEVDSHFMKLNQHSKQLNGIKNRMERDYGMLCGRYTKLFSGLNKNLENRVFALDKLVKIRYVLENHCVIGGVASRKGDSFSAFESVEGDGSDVYLTAHRCI